MNLDSRYSYIAKEELIMKCKVRLTRTVELFVEGKDEESILDWLYQTTPEGAYLAADGDVYDEYDDEILFEVRDDSVVNYVIKDKESQARQVSKEVIDSVLENQKGIEKYICFSNFNRSFRLFTFFCACLDDKRIWSYNENNPFVYVLCSVPCW